MTKKFTNSQASDIDTLVFAYAAFRVEKERFDIGFDSAGIYSLVQLNRFHRMIKTCIYNLETVQKVEKRCGLDIFHNIEEILKNLSNYDVKINERIDKLLRSGKTYEI